MGAHNFHTHQEGYISNDIVGDQYEHMTIKRHYQKKGPYIFNNVRTIYTRQVQ